MIWTSRQDLLEQYATREQCYAFGCFICCGESQQSWLIFCILAIFCQRSSHQSLWHELIGKSASSNETVHFQELIELN